MSTLKATNIKNVSSGTNNLVLGENGGVVISGLATVSNANVTGGTITGVSTIGVTTVTASAAYITGGSITGVSTVSSTAFSVNGNAYPSSGPLSNRNKIINGDMRIDQRNAGAAVISNGSYPVDRFPVANNTDGAFSAQQDSSAPAGFVNSTKITITTADATLGATQRILFYQSIEGTNTADFAWGTANAKTVTLSFWVRSSLTGTFGGSIKNSANNRAYPFTYSISVADTWEYKTVTIAGDTSGTWLTTTGLGVQLLFSLGSGADFSGTAGAWASANYTAPTGAVSVIGTLNATWYITGVQLEVGSVATPFEHRSYGDELARCQRYYQLFDSAAGEAYPTGGVGAYAICGVNFIQTMRAAPTVTLGTAGTSTNTSGDNFTTATPTAIGCVYRVVQGAGGGNYYQQRTSNTASAEL